MIYVVEEFSLYSSLKNVIFKRTSELGVPLIFINITLILFFHGMIKCSYDAVFAGCCLVMFMGS